MTLGILSMDVADVCHAVCELSNEQKYQLLNDHYKPSADYSFPITFSNGCYRSFQHRWLEKHPWLVYSKAAKGGFCNFCALFSKNRANLGVLVNNLSLTGSKYTKLFKVMNLTVTIIMLFRKA